MRKCLNYDLFDSMISLINQRNPFITKGKVQTSIFENFKQLLL